MPGKGGRRLVGAIIVLVGAILLIAAVFMPWYSEKISGTGALSGASITANSYPGLPSSNGTIQYTCSGLPTYFSCPSQTSYSNAKLTNTGNVAETGYFLLIAGFALGLIGAILGFVARGKIRWVTPAIALAILALILAVATPAMFAVALPGAIGSDSPNHSGTGPWSSFFGSTGNASNLGYTDASATWGPGIGWYLSFGAFVVVLIGAILLLTARKDPEPAPATAPAPQGTPSAPSSGPAPGGPGS